MRISAPLCALVALLSACSDPPATTDSGGDGSTGTTATTTAPTVPTTSMGDLTSTGFQLVCVPGDVRCSPDVGGVVETCKDTGLEWEQSACSANTECVEDVEAGTAACIGPCEKITNPTSIGCEFLAIRMNSFNDSPDAQTDALIVGNTDDVLVATVQLYFTPNNSLTEEPLFDPVALAPGESHVFDLANDPIGDFTNFRTGGVYRVDSDVPIAAYLHSSLDNKASNDSSMLLPTPTLRKDYVIGSYPGYTSAMNPMVDNGHPSYFNVIALEDDTTLEWTAPRDTAAQGVLIPAIAAGQTGSFLLNRFDILQVGSSSNTNMQFETHDLSGTVVSADKPIWVMGATACAFVPTTVGYCNHLQEQMIPLEYWGKKYVGPHSPSRADEKHYWRVYAGADGVSVAVESNNPQYPDKVITLFKRGDWEELEIPHGTSVIFSATGPILPVQYLAGAKASGDIGDPAMYQMVGVEQWLQRYVFVTGVGYDRNYAQVIRKKDAADVTLNGQTVTGYYLINGTGGDNQWEVADVELPPDSDAATFVAESLDPFNVIVVGFNVKTPDIDPNYSAYAYPGGMNLKPMIDG